MISCVAFSSCDSNSVRKPLFRNQATTTAIEGFKAATAVSSQQDKQQGYLWNAELMVGSLPLKVKITGTAYISCICVDYLDGLEPVRVFKPADDTNNKEVRVKGSTLYVYRSVTLVWTEYRLAVFDLVARKQTGDFLVARGHAKDSYT